MEGAFTYRLILLQVWRPSSPCSYILVGQHRVDNFAVGTDFLLDTASVSPPLDPIPVQPGDVLGIYVNQGQFQNAGVQQYASDMSTVVQVQSNQEAALVQSAINVCAGGATSITGAPILNAVVIEGK